MVRTWILIALISCLVVSVVGKKKSAAEQSQEKAEQRNRALSTLLSSTSTAPSSVVYLGDGNFTKFVVERPREYFAFLLFTATAAQYQCSVCVKTKQTFIDAANHYSNQFEFDTTPADRRIVFFVLEVDSARSVFSDMQLETVPRVYMLPPTTSKTPKSKISDFEVESRILLEGTASILGEVRSLTGVEVKILLDPAPFLLGLCLVALLVALFVSGAASDVLGSLLWYQSPKIWVVVSSICFGVGVSGSIFCVIRSAPPLGFGRGGSAVVFAGQGRDQYLVEGIFVALLTLGNGLALCLMVAATRIKRFPLFRHALVLLCATVSVVLLLQIWNAYVMKTGWYSLRETLPQELWTFLTSSVKRGSGGLKRLIRLSEYWLFESRSWDAFTKKFKALLWDYIVKQLQQATAFSKST